MIIPKKFSSGSHIRVIAPSLSGSIVSSEVQKIAIENLEKIGLHVSFGKNVFEKDSFSSSSIESRVHDLHEAFLDADVDGILTMIGGFNSNQLLSFIDWGIIQNNPKILCGFSDVTALLNAINTKTGLVTYSGMHFSTFGQKHLQEYNVTSFKKCLFSDEPFTCTPSEKWSDDEWCRDQDSRIIENNEGWWSLHEGISSGVVLGSNLATLRLLYGTKFMPAIKDSILFIEDDHYTTNDIGEFDRNLQSLIHQADFETIKALVIGRFQKGSKMTREVLTEIIETKKELRNIPVLANVDFGHTDPLFTFPIGGEVTVHSGVQSSLEFTKH